MSGSHQTMIKVDIGEGKYRLNAYMYENQFCSIELDSLNKKIRKSKKDIPLKTYIPIEEIQAVKLLLNKWLKHVSPEIKLVINRNHDLKLANTLKLFSIIYDIPYSEPAKITEKFIDTLKKINTGEIFGNRTKLKEAQKLYGLVKKYGMTKGINKFKQLKIEKSMGKLRVLKNKTSGLPAPTKKKLLEAAQKHNLAQRNLDDFIEDLLYYSHALGYNADRVISKILLSPANGFKIFSTMTEASIKYKVDFKLIAAVIDTESGFDPGKESPAGARGLMQLTKITAKELNIAYENLFDIETNIMEGTRYLRKMLDKFNNNNLALSAYNAGPTEVKKSLNEKGIPPNFQETKDFVDKVLRLCTYYA